MRCGRCCGRWLWCGARELARAVSSRTSLRQAQPGILLPFLKHHHQRSAACALLARASQNRLRFISTAVTMAEESKASKSVECWETPAWAALQEEAKAVDGTHLRDMMEVCGQVPSFAVLC